MPPQPTLTHPYPDSRKLRIQCKVNYEYGAVKDLGPGAIRSAGAPIRAPGAAPTSAPSTALATSSAPQQPAAGAAAAASSTALMGLGTSTRGTHLIPGRRHKVSIDTPPPPLPSPFPPPPPLPPPPPPSSKNKESHKPFSRHFFPYRTHRFWPSSFYASL